MTRLSRRIHETLTEVAEAAAAAEVLCSAAGADESQSLRIGLALDELAADRVSNRIGVAPETKQLALVALERMLANVTAQPVAIK